jgi:hypothetical protein
MVAIGTFLSVGTTSARLPGPERSCPDRTFLPHLRSIVVMTAVEGAFASEICTSAVCTAMAEMPNIPAVIAIPEFGSEALSAVDAAD